MPFFDDLLQIVLRGYEPFLQDKRRREALGELQQGLTVNETIPTPPMQAPAQAGGRYNPITGMGARLNIPPLSLAQPPTQEQRQIGIDDPRAINPVLNYLSSTGQDIGLNTLMSLFQAGQPKTSFINQEYGGVDIGRIYPGGRAEVERAIPPNAELRKNANTVRENPNQWLADSMNPNTTPQERDLAKQKYDSYVKNQGSIAGVRAEAGHPFSLQDRQIKSYVGKDNLTRIIWQKPSGETYETLSKDESATTDQRNREISLGRVDPVMSAISELSEKINTGRGVIAKISGGVERAKAEANLNDDVAEYQSLIAGFTPLVARAVGHTGVLTEQDVQSVKELFPKPGDSKTLRDRKIARVKSILGAIRGETPSGVPKDEDFDKMTDEQLQEYLNKK